MLSPLYSVYYECTFKHTVFRGAKFNFQYKSSKWERYFLQLSFLSFLPQEHATLKALSISVEQAHPLWCFRKYLPQPTLKPGKGTRSTKRRNFCHLPFHSLEEVSKVSSKPQKTEADGLWKLRNKPRGLSLQKTGWYVIATCIVLCNYKKQYSKGRRLAGPDTQCKSAQAVTSQQHDLCAEEMYKEEHPICLFFITMGLFPCISCIFLNLPSNLITYAYSSY